MQTLALILAAGTSTRCGFDKIFHKTKERFLIEKTLQPFQDCASIDEIKLVLNTSQVDHFQDLAAQFDKIKGYTLGGSERFYSLCCGLESIDTLAQESDIQVVVHNGANPHITAKDLEKSLKLTQEHPHLIFGYFTPNSIKRVKEGKVIAYLDRDEIFETQTPQISTLKVLKQAAEIAQKQKVLPRDEAELLHLIGEDVSIYECSQTNQKVTYPEDFGIDARRPVCDAEGFLNQTGLGSGERGFKFGVGEDSHRFTKTFDPQKPVVLGGLNIPESQLTFDANSDGDVILHSLCNAILNALGEKTFDTFATPMCQQGLINSERYLEKTLKILAQNTTDQLQQVRISLEGLRPKIAPYHEAIIKNLSRILNIDPPNIGLTYTTGEALTAFGRGEGIRCTVYVILSSRT